MYIPVSGIPLSLSNMAFFVSVLLSSLLVLGKIREKSNQPNNQIRTLYPEPNRMAAGVVLEKEAGELG